MFKNSTTYQTLQAAKPEYIKRAARMPHLDANAEFQRIENAIEQFGFEIYNDLDQSSIYYTVLEMAEVALSIEEGLNHATLLFNKHPDSGDYELCYYPIYHGMIQLLKESNCVKRIDAALVYNGDNFVFQGINKDVIHEATFNSTGLENIQALYGRVEGVDGEIYVEVLEREFVEATIKHHQNSPVASSLWSNEFVTVMLKKTALRRVIASCVDLFLHDNPELKIRLQALSRIERRFWSMIEANQFIDHELRRNQAIELAKKESAEDTAFAFKVPSRFNAKVVTSEYTHIIDRVPEASATSAPSYNAGYIMGQSTEQTPEVTDCNVFSGRGWMDDEW
ncbi:recombinase RecT [Vibrio chaetopteri]|uniref:Recombinase RecT n=1 Tax=Vibrio chaetopteri TaxID=3016528 RepID=A0AAU8BRA7_9VIBR